ncbi:MAG: hypothetical protein ACXWJV_00905 [Hyphomicrobium sp.]
MVEAGSKMGTKPPKEETPKGEADWVYLSSTRGVATGTPERDRIVEVRKQGRLRGARANKKKGERYRKAIVRLAREVWDRNLQLKNNLSATAREIEGKKDEALKTGPHSYLGADAIRKHLSKLRKEGKL